MIEVCHKSNVRANCLPEMKKDRVYKLVMKLDSQSCEIDEAQCGCPAGRGPKASCKHIAALCYALEEFTRLRQLPDFVACTDRLQTWNQPRPKKLKPIPVEDMRTRKQQLMPPPVRACQQTRAVSQFDPRPKEFRAINPETLENFRCGLLKLNKPCAFTQLLIPSVDKVDHDHSYCNRSGSVMASTTMSTVVEDDQVKSQKSQIVDARIMSETVMAEVKDGLNVSSRMRMEIEMKTRQQSAEKEWHTVRVRRITSSTCGQILTQKSKTVALLVRVLYHKRLTPPPPPIAWGLQNEQVACRSYQQHMLSIGHSGLTTQPIGFIVHPTKGWFGASPDAKVYDPSSHANCHGIAEFKCPYSKRDISPQEACQDPQFCCELQSGTTHTFYQK